MSETINQPRGTVYQFWRQLDNLTRFMAHVHRVTPTRDGRWHWVVTTPAGRAAEWDATVVADRPNEGITWRTVDGSNIHHEGSVRFTDAPAGRGTEIQVDLQYDAPAGKAGTMIAQLFGDDPPLQIREDLRRCKQVMESDEVARNQARCP